MRVDWNSGFLSILTAVCCMVVASHASAEMYKWVDEQGVTQYSDTPPENASMLEIRGKISSYTSPTIQNLPESFFLNSNKPDRKKRVVMYSAEWCGICKRAKVYFQKNNIRFTEYDIDKSEKAKMEFDRLNGKGVPIILIGRKRLNGFSSERFEQIYYN